MVSAEPMQINRPELARGFTDIAQRAHATERLRDGLSQTKARPHFVETAVRSALRDSITWRIGGGKPPFCEAFVGAAIAAARQSIDARDTGPLERSQTLSAVAAAAQRFGASALFRRLMTVPSMQFMSIAPTVSGPDVIVRDRRRRLHAVALTLRRETFDVGELATELAYAAPLQRADRLLMLNVHIYSLSSGTRRVFVRDVSVRHASGGVRVA